MTPALHALRAALAAGAIVFAALGEWGWALQAGAAAAAVAATWALRVPRGLDAAFTLALSLLVWGGRAGLDAAVRPWDLVLHAVVPVFAAPTLYFAALRAGVARPPAEPHPAAVAAVTAALGIALGGAWEILEYGVDLTGATSFVKGTRDTATDLLADALGSLAGGAGLAAWAARRRIEP